MQLFWRSNTLRKEECKEILVLIVKLNEKTVYRRSACKISELFYHSDVGHPFETTPFSVFWFPKASQKFALYQVSGKVAYKLGVFFPRNVLLMG